ncbi:MAG: proton-conducting transporter membrane subunit, partial [Paracoccaceae bacterium]
MSLILLVSLPFLGAILTGLAGQRAALVAGFVTALACACLGWLAPAVLDAGLLTARIDWVPVLGLSFGVRLDGLGLLFAILILGIGLLVILYAAFYLDRRERLARFFSYILLFQGSMLGIVLSDNILLLAVFWELTSLSSFLLIGFWNHLPEGRRGARMALAVTGAGGLALLAGLLILGQIAGSYELSVILTKGAQIQASPLYLPALVLVLLGAFTKSAQVPFQFWLPKAMAAPTPVSAYLHSATMVKAGIFLMARLWPVLAGTPEWFGIVATVGLVTFLLGAWVALFKDDLKALLAYSTVSHLGLITLLLGLGTKAALIAALFHILNHASFKAALFLSAGIVDHGAGTRSIARLGGLARLMPVAFVLAGLAALSMAGVPPLNGFLSKEMLLEQAVHTGFAGSPWLLAALVTLGAAVSAGYSFRLIGAVFLGPARVDYPHTPHDARWGMSGPVLLLVMLVLAIGLAPMLVAGGLIEAASVASAQGAMTVSIKLWHGLEPAALWLSLAALGGGLVFYGALPRFVALERVLPEAAKVFDGVVARLVRLAKAATRALHDGPLAHGLGMALTLMVGLSAHAFVSGSHEAGLQVGTPLELAPVVLWVGLVLATLAVTILHRNRVLALVLVGVIGLVLSVGFAYLAAPDLALTQIAVEV